MCTRKGTVRLCIIVTIVVGIGNLGGIVCTQAPIPPCAASCDEFGCLFRDILNLPLGGVTLSLNEECQLVVGNIGTGGFDGVVQTDLQSVYMKSVLATPNLSASMLGTKVEIIQMGVGGGMPDQELMRTTIVNFDGDNLRHVVDCSKVQVEYYSIDVYDGNDLVQHQDLGVDPPALIAPKEDIRYIACGIYPNGDLYTVFQMGSPQPITFFTSSTPGPYTGDVVFVTAYAPHIVPTLQTDIIMRLVNVMSITLASMEVSSSLPGDGFPCPGNCAADLSESDAAVRQFIQAGFDAMSACAERATPICPAPCPDFPTLEESGLSPRCYKLLSCYLDELASSVFASSWGADRCPEGLADACALVQAQALGDLIEQLFERYRTGQASMISGDVEACHQTIDEAGGACPSGICDKAPAWVEGILGPS